MILFFIAQNNGNLAENTSLLVSLSLLHVGVCFVVFTNFFILVTHVYIKKQIDFAFNRRTFYNLHSKIYTSWLNIFFLLFFFFSLFSILSAITFMLFVYVLRSMRIAWIKVSLICAGMFCSLYNRHTKKKKNGNAILHAHAGFAFNTIDMQILLMLWCAVYGGGGKNVTMDDRVVSKLLLYSVLAKNWIWICWQG